MNIPMTDLTLQYKSIKNEIDSAIFSVLESGRFILGSEVEAFEREMAAYCGVKNAIGVASGTDALQLALLACGVGFEDEVITTPFTFIATVESIVKCGAKPVFVDIDPVTFNIDVKQIKSRVTRRTKAILPVHLYGQPSDMKDLLDISKSFGLKVIEDCAQAAGAEYKTKKVGTIGDVGCFSFFPAKNLGAYGDGGMVISNNDEIADTVRLLHVHGAKKTYYHTMHGYNSRLDAIQAAILRVKLRHLEQWNNMRLSNAITYTKLLSNIKGIVPMHFDSTTRSSCNYYTIRISDPFLNRQELKDYLELHGIQTNIYYPLSLHLQEVYQDLGYKQGDFPESELAQQQVLSLPMYPELSKEQIKEIISQIAQFIGGSENA